jgi:hypothetical protein
MMAGKLRKYLSKPLPPLEGQTIITPIILTHSEGRYLKDICTSQRKSQIMEIKSWSVN